MERYFLYGSRGSGVDEVAEALAARLGREFEERDSDYAGAYRLARFDLTEIKVMSWLDAEGDPVEPEFDGYQTVVYLATEDEDFEPLNAIAGLELLRQE